MYFVELGVVVLEPGRVAAVEALHAGELALADPQRAVDARDVHPRASLAAELDPRVHRRELPLGAATDEDPDARADEVAHHGRRDAVLHRQHSHLAFVQDLAHPLQREV